MYYLLLLGSLGCAYSEINGFIYTIIIFAPLSLRLLVCSHACANIASYVAKNIHFASMSNTRAAERIGGAQGKYKKWGPAKWIV